MKIYDGIDEFERLENAVVTSGTFDGVHVGHQKIIERLKATAKQLNGNTVILTFWPHPRIVLYPEQHDLKLLTTFEEKAELLKKEGIEHLIKIHFTSEFSKMSSEEFIRKILVDKIGTRKLVIGYDHRFGRNREGSFKHLQANSKRYGFEVTEIPEQDIDHVAVSSSRIRKALTNGDIDTANEYLGRPYMLTGTVIKGDKIGRELGFPTANLEVPEANKLIPEDGIYAVKISHDGNAYNGMMYIGLRPTINGTFRTIEVNIFEFDRNIYNDHLTVHFYKQIRGDTRFNSLENLRDQLYSDREQARKILNTY